MSSTLPASATLDAGGRSSALPHGAMVHIVGGTFVMGSDDFYAEEKPARRVKVSAFRIDRHPVTNREFAAFVEDSGYVTVAERPLDPALYPGVPLETLLPGSLVFGARGDASSWQGPADWWDYVAGACWRHPRGPGSSLAGLEDHPVVHVSYEDAESYARWAGKSLPTEAEWEFASRGGLDGAAYVWGDEFMPGGRRMANTWPGDFPLPAPGQSAGGTSCVGSFPANGYGLHDMTGNVWEWTSDWYGVTAGASPAKACCIPSNPRGCSEAGSYDPAQPGVRIPRKVLKGGSFLCAPNYCRRYRPAARQPQMIDSAASHIGFRCIVHP